MSHYPPPTIQEWLDLIADQRYASMQVAWGHQMQVARPGLVQARCSCGWDGPDRTGDPHAVGLVVDDVDWHTSVVVDDARRRTLEHGGPRPMWWQR